MTMLKKFMPLTAIAASATVFYQHSTHHNPPSGDELFSALEAGFPDDSEQRRPRWPLQARRVEAAVTASASTNIRLSLPVFD